MSHAFPIRRVLDSSIRTKHLSTCQHQQRAQVLVRSDRPQLQTPVEEYYSEQNLQAQQGLGLRRRSALHPLRLLAPGRVLVQRKPRGRRYSIRPLNLLRNQDSPLAQHL